MHAYEDNRVIEMLITPITARAILERSEKTGFINRKISKMIVSRYAEAMVKGLWVLSNDVILITSDGKLINGQHRLMAIIKSNTAQKFLVMHNAKEESFKFLDTGKPRSLNDYVRSYGLENSTPTIAAAAFYILFSYKNNKLYCSPKKGHTTYSYEDTVTSLIEKHYPLFVRAQKLQIKQQKNSFIPARSFVICYVLFSFIHEELAETFFETLRTKIWGENKTFATLYNAFQKMPKNLHSEGRNRLVMKYMFAAWNAFVKGKYISRLTITPDDTLPELEDFDADSFFGDILSRIANF